MTDDTATVFAVGVLAATLATFCHETVGHGLACVAVGGRITLLTSIWFRCRDATALTDAGGPLASLVAGAAAFVFLSSRRPSRVVRLLLVQFGAISLFWFSGQLVFHAWRNADDWFFIARRMGWPWEWRPVAATLGAASYVAATRITMAALSRIGPAWLPAIRLAYVAAALSALIAGLMWRPDPVGSAVEGFLTLGIVPLGLLGAAWRADRHPGPIPVAAPVVRSWRWIVVGLVVFGAFASVQGRGLGSLAPIGLQWSEGY